MPRSTPAPDTFPPAGPGEGRGRGDGAEVGRGGRVSEAQLRRILRDSPSSSARRAAGMRRAGPCCLLLAAACALGRTPPPSPPSAVRCQAAGACFSAHLANSTYTESRSACGRRRGDLAWVSGEAELRLLLGLLAAAGSAPSLFWVGLKRNASACTDADQPLRGFSWDGGGAAPREVPAALGRWVKEPVRSCLAVRCAGLHLAAAAPGGDRGWGWKERPCHRPSQGYACKYPYEGACPDLRPAAVLHLDYRLPFEESSAGPGFSPPGTVLSVTCPGGEVQFTCQPEAGGGFAWKGVGDPLCPCGYRSPGSDGDGTPCAATGATTTAAAGAPAEPPGGGSPPPGGSAGPPAGGEKTVAPPPPSSSSPSSSSSNYVFILVTVAVVVLVILVMTVLGVFKLCFNKKSEGGGDKEPPEAGSKAEAGCAEPSGAGD
ncbi:C-type lectin domain family 14 member A [Larus michahellis]